VGQRHGVTLANVATRWVLQHEAVACVIVGCRLGHAHHREDNQAMFTFKLDDEDLASIQAVLTQATGIPGDCGDEYRQPPFLTASGDLSHHINALPKSIIATPHLPPPQRGLTSGEHVERGLVAQTGTNWEEIASFSRFSILASNKNHECIVFTSGVAGPCGGARASLFRGPLQPTEGGLWGGATPLPRQPLR
jgi:hypothetical protein